jgi:hypothetical protein
MLSRISSYGRCKDQGTNQIMLYNNVNPDSTHYYRTVIFLVHIETGLLLSFRDIFKTLLNKQQTTY